MRKLTGSLTIALAAIAFAGVTIGLNLKVRAAGTVTLTGSVKSDSGEKMEGVTISAKADGQTITTSLFTDEDGNYYFPPLANGKYSVWAQTAGYETARAEVTIDGSIHRQDFALKTFKDFPKQLTGQEWTAALPEDTPQHRRMKQAFVGSCTGCHPASYILQNRFDEAGWNSMLNLMTKIGDEHGSYGGPGLAPLPEVQYLRKELAAYLTEMRGPGPSPMQFKPKARPSGDSTLALITEYDIHLDMDGGYGPPVNEGSDWMQGTPSNLDGNHGIHDTMLDLNSNVWFAYADTSAIRTIAKVDAKSGAVTNIKVTGPDGMALSGHGIARDQQGILWFNAGEGQDGGAGGLGRIDPTTNKVDVYRPPAGMAGVGGNIDVDNEGNIWAVSETGALRFDPKTREFMEFKSPTYGSPDGESDTYGDTVDSDGNGWWTQMELDRVNKGIVKSGESIEIKMPPRQRADMNELVTPEQRKVYEMSGIHSHNQAFPWTETPRRLAADKNSDVVWVCNFYGNSLAKINIHTLKITLYPVPLSNSGPYAAAVDSKHNVWIDLTQSDQVDKFDPSTGRWTQYNLPTLGAATRHIGLLERDGKVELSLGYARLAKVARMEFRTKEELQALRDQVSVKVGRASNQ